MVINTSKELEQISRLVRINIIDMLYKIGADYKGHPGPALSIVDLVTCLYFKVMKIDPKNPRWVDRDRLAYRVRRARPLSH